jgi:hypothetical protein
MLSVEPTADLWEIGGTLRFEVEEDGLPVPGDFHG